MTTGWKLDRAEREALLVRFAPRWPDADADHVTLQSGATEPPPDAAGAIVGHVDDGGGLEAMVATVNGTTERPDGGTFHITWSLDKAAGRRAVQSNDVLREQGWTTWDEPVPISLTGAAW